MHPMPTLIAAMLILGIMDVMSKRPRTRCRRRERSQWGSYKAYCSPQMALWPQRQVSCWVVSYKYRDRASDAAVTGAVAGVGPPPSLMKSDSVGGKASLADP